MHARKFGVRRASYLRAKESFFAKCPLDLLANTFIFNESISDCTNSCPLDREKRTRGAQIVDFIGLIQRTFPDIEAISGKIQRTSYGHFLSP